MLMIAAGAMMTMSDTSANSLRQTTAPMDALGKTVSLFMFATEAVNRSALC